MQKQLQTLLPYNWCLLKMPWKMNLLYVCCNSAYIVVLNIIFTFIIVYSNFLAIKDSRQSASDKRRIARQRGLLLEKLEDFRRINKSVRQKLKQLQDSEVGYNTTLYISQDSHGFRFIVVLYYFKFITANGKTLTLT